MPRSRQPRHLYGVFVFAHTSAAKEDFTVRMLYLDTGERQALLTFARATIEAAKDPLVYAVALEKDLQTVVRVKVEHPNLPDLGCLSLREYVFTDSTRGSTLSIGEIDLARCRFNGDANFRDSYLQVISDPLHMNGVFLSFITHVTSITQKARLQLSFLHITVLTHSW